MYISPYDQGNHNHDLLRSRKLLLYKKQIATFGLELRVGGLDSVRNGS